MMWVTIDMLMAAAVIGAAFWAGVIANAIWGRKWNDKVKDWFEKKFKKK